MPRNKEQKKEYDKANSTTPLRRFSKAKAQAKERKIDWDMTFEQFINISSKPCVYCNEFLVDYKKTTGTHLDRIDNDAGYTIENVVSCCKVCNYIRGYHLTPEETKAAVKAIIKIRKSKK